MAWDWHGPGPTQERVVQEACDALIQYGVAAFPDQWRGMANVCMDYTSTLHDYGDNYGWNTSAAPGIQRTLACSVIAEDCAKLELLGYDDIVKNIRRLADGSSAMTIAALYQYDQMQRSRSRWRLAAFVGLVMVIVIGSVSW